MLTPATQPLFTPGVCPPFGRSIKVSTLAQKIKALFASSEQGAWYDPSDLTTLFQNSAGATPVTAVEQPVGKMNDKSGRGNHALQATAAARPVLSARVNLLIRTQEFDNATWSKTAGTVSANTMTAPDGTLSADVLVESTANTLFAAFSTAGVVALVPHTCSVYVKRGSGSRNALIQINNTTDTVASFVFFDLDAVTASAPSDLIAGFTAQSAAITNVGNGFFRCSFTVTPPAGTTGLKPYFGLYAGARTYTGDGVSSLGLWGAQMESGSVATYQRVNTASDYDTAGFPYYEKLDGIDDSMSSATGGGGTAGFFFCTAVKPTAGAGALRTIWSDTGTNSGYKVQLDAANKLSFSAGNGTAFTTIASTATVDVGTTSLITVWDDGTNLNVQIGSAAAQTVARPVVTAGTAAFTLGKDNGAATSFFTGNLYPEVYRQGSGLTATQRTSVQTYCKSKAGL